MMVGGRRSAASDRTRKTSARAAAEIWTGTAQLLSLLNGVAQSTVEEFAAAASTIELPPRAEIYPSGARCTGLHVVLSGRVKLSLPVSESAHKVIALLGPGTWFGEGALFLRERHALSASTIQRSALAHIPAATVLRCLNEDDSFALKMLTETSRRLRRTMLDCAAASSPARRRVIGFLLDELASAKASSASAEILLPAVKRVIASRLSISGEHLSRVFRELTRARLIRVDGPHVFVRSVSRLRDAYSNSSR